METEKVNASHQIDASVIRGGSMQEGAEVHGRFEAVCVGPDGKEKWRDSFDNLVVTEGKNQLLDSYLAGSA